ncbi:actin-bundling protein FimA [Volvox carteri f. nagariensis]|uniref:Actin-bundling protein FimA n=1 Tax=Volvox carteri f. nagariensis TaxID=3068 RepID=D8TSW1_VOLCA|nr:actin-bundling protein FimA [Volvox carteri f. nagariensis]EFJ49550.1 actin-bundling protein FimA [Volvox carteri f. nagariensis]|eukprot:XP_002949531.1 actin-bundling protein FimA [Volvox carteri f. nagariensis]
MYLSVWVCLGCAHAQGCDLQGISVEQLYACEVSCLTDFVLEVLRLSAVQALPASDRQVLAAPASQAAASLSLAGGSFRHTGRTAPGSHNCQALGVEYSLQTQSSGNSNRSSDEGGGGDGDGATTATAKVGVVEHVGHAFASAQQPGTAAARRAVAGLECWVLQLVDALPVKPSSSPVASSGPATPATVSRAGSMTAVAPELSAALCPATAGASAPCANGTAPLEACKSTGIPASCPRGCNISSMGTEADVGSDLFNGRPSKDMGADKSSGGRFATAGGDGGTGGGGGAGTNLRENSHGSAVDTAGAGCCTSEPDPIRLEVWEGLAAILSRPLGSDAGSAAVSGPAYTTTSNAAAVAVPRTAPGAASSCGSPRTAGVATQEGFNVLSALPQDADAPAHACLGIRPPSAVDGGVGDGGKREARWAEVAQALSNALAAGVPAHGSPQLPALRSEHLQCRHPGLRSLLLARALLVHCCLRDGMTATAARAVRSRADGSTSSSSSGVHQVGTGEVSPGRADGASQDDAAVATAAAAAIAAAAAAASKILPGSPAPPLPPLREPAASTAGGPAAIRRNHSMGGRPPIDLLSEHNLLVQKEHQQRELRRQQRQKHNRAGAGGGGGPTGGDRPRSTIAEPRVVLWSGDGDDEEGTDQEERVLRLWLNSLDPGIHVTSLFEQEITTGWPLLLALQAIQPGCVPWSDAFRPPFKEKLRKILSVQNCNLVIEVCTRQLAMPPLVNIGGLDLALFSVPGQRRATLSLVFQMMRHHMGMLLGLAAPVPYPNPPTSPQRLPAPGAMPTLGQSYSFGHSYSPSHALGHSYGLNHSYGGHSHSSGLICGHEVSPHAQHVPFAPSPQRGSRAHVEVEKAVLAWANAKLLEAAAAAAAADRGETDEVVPAGCGVAPQLPFTPLVSFSDKRLGEGSVLLQLLAAICPRSVNPKYVLPGRNAEERGSNARYLLSCARKLGCVIFLAWEDVVAARPNLLLLLLASFMALDRKRLGAAAAAGATAAAGGEPPAAAAAAAQDRNAQSAPGGMGGREVVEPRASSSLVAAEPASPYPL